MNFNFNEIEEKESGNYLTHGVHKVKVKSVELKECATANYTGDAWDITIEDESGASSSIRMFPFKYNPTLNKYEKGQVVGLATEVEQWKSYQAKIKHLFTKALGEENFEKTVKAAKDLKTLFKFLGQACAKYGKEFAIMLVSDKKGYAKMPLWENGYVAHLENIEKLNAAYTKNSVKYGPKTAPTNTEAPSANSQALDDLFASTTAPQESVPVTEEDDDLPF